MITYSRETYKAIGMKIWNTDDVTARALGELYDAYLVMRGLEDTQHHDRYLWGKILAFFYDITKIGNYLDFIEAFVECAFKKEYSNIYENIYKEVKKFSDKYGYPLSYKEI